MKCIHCSHENEDNAVFCSACGMKINGENISSQLTAPLKSASQPAQLNVTRLIWKIMLMIGGLIGAFYAIATIDEDKTALFGYNYKAPLTDHETGIIALLVISIIIFIIGCFIPVFSHSQNE